MKKACTLAMFLVFTVLATISVQADSVTVDSEVAYDGAVQIDGTVVWDAQNLHAGNEDVYLQCLTAGVIKFQLPTLPENIFIDKVTLVLNCDGRDIATSLGLKQGDSNYPNGPFFQLQHYTYDNNVVLCTNDATDTRVENSGDIDVAAPWGVKSLDVTNAVHADLDAGYTYTSYRIQATDYTGRLLTTADLTAFSGYLTSFFGAGSGGYKPYLKIDYSSIRTVDVSAGQIQGIWPDTVNSVEEGGYPFVRVVNNDTANKSYQWMMLDLGSSQYVTSFTMTNRLDMGTLFNVAQVEVYVSPQEGNQGFDPHRVSNYTTCVFSGIPTLDSYLAGVKRTISVNASQRYFLFKIVSNYRGYYGFPDLTTIADFSDLEAVSQIDVSAGKIYGLDGDTVEPVTETENDYIHFRAFNRDYPNKTDECFLLDMGQIRKVTSLMIANRCDIGSLYNVGQVQVYVAPDETAESFDPFSSSSYTRSVFSGLASPENYTQSLRRTVDITDSARRYFMIKIVSNLFSYYGVSVNQYADFDDIRAMPEPMPMGWYDSATDPTYYVNEMANGGTKVILAYTTGADAETLATYLNNAKAAGVKVILELPRSDVSNQNVTALSDFIKTYRNYSAVDGWYIWDEPSPSQYQFCKTAYDTIRENSSKPAFLCFAGNNDNLISFADAYDVLVYDFYPCKTGESEFTGSDTFMTVMDSVNSKAGQAGKLWWPVLQGVGQVSNQTWNLRLPTFNESRFMTYYCVDKNASGYLNFYYPFCKMTTATPSDPYPDSGQQWLTDVFPTVFGEINTLAPALAAGRLSASFISDNSSKVNSSLWQDPNTGSYYLIAVNTATTTGNATFTLAMPDVKIGEVQPLFENRQPISFSGNNFSDSFSQYHVHVYKLTFVAATKVPGDANGDWMVDVGDLGILAANYGTATGATWAKGDFNGDGAVDVGDLGILAAHYGTGSNATFDFSTDYVKAFGTTVVEDSTGDTADETGSSVCSGLGLPLVAGVMLLGLMLVKLEE
jgi:hypothetical protein